MDDLIWLSLVPPLLTVALAILTKNILASLGAGLLAGSFIHAGSFISGFETAVTYIIKILSDEKNIEVLLFLYLFSGIVFLVKRAGGIKAFSNAATRYIESKRGVFFTLWGLIPISFIDCGFRVVAAGSIIRPLAEKYQVARERLAFMLNNTASPVVELVPVATTFVGFNIGIINQGLTAAGEQDVSAYSILLRSIPLQFFSIVVLIITFASIYFNFKNQEENKKKREGKENGNEHEKGKGIQMSMKNEEIEVDPKILNLIVPLLSIILLSLFFFWYFGKEKVDSPSLASIIAATEPNKAMLVALLISLLISGVLYAIQKYPVKKMATDVISGGNEITNTLAILVLAWPLAQLTLDLGLSRFIQSTLGNSLSAIVVPAALFAVSSAVTYLIGSSWGAASLIMPFAIPLAVNTGAGIPLAVAAVITGGTFGDITSPVSGMTNMASNISKANHMKYIRYTNPYNFTAAGITAVLFFIAAWLMK